MPKTGTTRTRMCSHIQNNHTISKVKGSTPCQVCCPQCFSLDISYSSEVTNMIPDDTIIFNHSGATRHFDDHEVRLRHLLQQDATSTLEGGRHLLFICQVCKRPWYKAGRREYPRLTLEQLAFPGASLHADIHALHLLPRSLCSICSTIYLGGMFTVGAYPHHRGYRFLWASASPRSIQLLAIVCRSEGLRLDTLLEMSPDVLISLAVAIHSLPLSPFTSLLLSWSVLARAMRTVL